MKKTILIYGDSNAWGCNEIVGRYPFEKQWANILAKKLGENYKVVQEGLPGRFAGDFEYREKPYYNGQYCYEPIYRTASPVDLVILALGTNDLNDRYNRSVDEIFRDILWYEKKTESLIREGEKMPNFLYILPPNFSGKFRDDETFNVKKREILNAKLSQKVANFIEINDIDLSDDELHFSFKGHKQMADAVFAKIKEMENE